MTSTKEQDRNPRISLARPGGRLELKKTVDSGMVRQSFSHGRSKSVAVEVKRKRNIKPAPGGLARTAEAPDGRTDEATRREGQPLRARTEGGAAVAGE
ncbi:MAG: translation initiation factor IF-2 associated domain-containing protein, partial [Geminicoccales bacterium]